MLVAAVVVPPEMVCLVALPGVTVQASVTAAAHQVTQGCSCNRVWGSRGGRVYSVGACMLTLYILPPPSSSSSSMPMPPGPPQPTFDGHALHAQSGACAMAAGQAVAAWRVALA